MEFIGAIITGVRAIAGVVYPPIKKKYFDQPKIYLQFKYESGTKKPLGLSPLNDKSQPIDIISAKYHNELTWRYALILRNNSEHTAYNIKLIEPIQDNSFQIITPIELLKPLQSNAEESYEVRFNLFYIGTGNEASKMIEDHPELLITRKYLLEYSNTKGTKFYTVFDGSKNQQERNSFLKKLKNDEG